MSSRNYQEIQGIEGQWFGSVPAHWSAPSCRAIVSERTDKNDDGSCTDYLSLMANTGVIPYEEKGDIGNKKPEDLSKCKIVFPGDFVINSMNYYIGSYGVSSYKGVCSPVYIVLRHNDLVVDSGFAFRILQTREFQEYAQSFGNGILEHRRSINWSILKSIKVPLPPLSEQRSIAAFLDAETSKIDALVAEQRRLIELLKEKRQAVISHAVTKGLNPHVKMKPSGIDWLGDVPEHWEVPPVFARYSCVLGKMLDERKQSGDFGVPYLRNADVNWDRINIDGLPIIDIKPEEYDRFTLQNGDILICEGGAGIGQTAIWQGGLKLCAFQKALHRLRPWKEDLENPRFFYYCMSYFVHSGVALRGGTATIPHLTGEQLRKYRLPRPPKSEQDAIVDFLDLQTKRFIKLEDDAGVAISLLQERRTALISAAVTGIIDVRGFVPKEATS